LELARKSGVSRAIIANYETGVTSLTVENALVIYMILEAYGSKEAGRAVRAILEILRKAVKQELAVVDTELNALQKRRQQLLARLAEIES
jgi:transcriptional regulator with XRE-family HTH domain